MSTFSPKRKKKKNTGNCCMNVDGGVDPSFMMEKHYLKSMPPPPPPPRRNHRLLREKVSMKVEKIKNSLSLSLSTSSEEEEDDEHEQEIEAVSITPKQNRQRQVVPIVSRNQQLNQMYPQNRTFSSEDPFLNLSSDHTNSIYNSKDNQSTSCSVSTIPKKDTTCDQNMYYHRYLDNNENPDGCEVDCSFDSKVDWTPQDSAYGAACPMFGCIPKKIRRRVEFFLLLFIFIGLIYFIVVVSMNLTNEHSQNKSQRSNNEDNKQNQQAVDLDDNFYVDYSDMKYYTGSNDDRLQDDLFDDNIEDVYTNNDDNGNN